MGTIKVEKVGRLRRLPQSALWLFLSAVVGCGGPAQIGPDREAFTTIDALYTAVSLREPTQVDRCASTLASLRDQKKLPEPAHDALRAIIAEAKEGAWESSQSKLRQFMLGQRR